jgi:hypothetical protein
LCSHRGLRACRWLHDLFDKSVASWVSKLCELLIAAQAPPDGSMPSGGSDTGTPDESRVA